MILPFWLKGHSLHLRLLLQCFIFPTLPHLNVASPSHWSFDHFPRYSCIDQHFSTFAGAFHLFHRGNIFVISPFPDGGGVSFPLIKLDNNLIWTGWNIIQQCKKENNMKRANGVERELNWEKMFFCFNRFWV